MDTKSFRDTLGQFATGITVVISGTGGTHYHGMTVNSFTSVSIQPPLVLFCADSRSETFKAVEASGRFTVSMLNEDHQALSERFAVKGPQTALFHSLNLRWGQDHIPYLADGLAFLDCALDRIIPAGDHFLVLGRVNAFDRLRPGRPLLYYQSHYQHLEASPGL